MARVLVSRSLPKTLCLRFVDPYGNTVFNQLQIPDLIRELQQLSRGAGASETLDRMIELAQKSNGEVHTYLKFIGD